MRYLQLQKTFSFWLRPSPPGLLTTLAFNCTPMLAFLFLLSGFTSQTSQVRNWSKLLHCPGWMTSKGSSISRRRPSYSIKVVSETIWMASLRLRLQILYVILALPGSALQLWPNGTSVVNQGTLSRLPMPPGKQSVPASNPSVI